MIRSILEKLSRGIVFKKKISGILGTFKIYLTPEAGLQFWFFSLNTHNNRILESSVKQFIKENDVVWDIGANMGLFSYIALANFQKIKCLAVEPDILLCNLIRKTIKRHPYWDMQILPLAISNSVGLATFNIANRSRQTNHLASHEGSSQTGGIRYSLTVPTFTIDKLAENYSIPDFIKIDVEGAEILTIEGGINTIQKYKPTILCECLHNNFPSIEKILNEANYHTFWDAEQLPQLIPFDSTKSENFVAIANK